MGSILSLLDLEDGDVAEEGALVPLAQRMDTLRSWLTEARP